MHRPKFATFRMQESNQDGTIELKYLQFTGGSIKDGHACTWLLVNICCKNEKLINHHPHHHFFHPFEIHGEQNFL